MKVEKLTQPQRHEFEILSEACECGTKEITQDIDNMAANAAVSTNEYIKEHRKFFRSSWIILLFCLIICILSFYAMNVYKTCNEGFNRHDFKPDSILYPAIEMFCNWK
ncbi:hypothetical protein PVAND_009754 [Polypedilum vanderplanki]|uniref:Uncharacterized protein n=1 Tax=Polypedilum vanderplanki TaxID=319348 RepID=A0A9J6CE63_POLVA|nr:hypothetical protein PVAND_009754 [Polypedilum vanderplanki]